MSLWISLFSLMAYLSCLQSKNLFFKDLTVHPLYKTNHMYRQLDTVTFRDSIMYVQEMDYLLISTNNSILNLDLYTLNELQKLTVFTKWSPDYCFVDRNAPEYSCHLFGYWSKLITLSTDSSVNQLFVCRNDGKATYHNLQNLNNPISPESGCPALSIISMFASDQSFYVGDVKDGRKILRFQPKFSEKDKTIKKRNLHTLIDSNWLQQNDYLQFVFIFENGNFVYFLFHEIAEEDTSYCHVKGVKSRISRISKDDKGGSNYRLSNNWITFTKATIICFDDDFGNLDSSLRYIESAFYDNERKSLYATFSSGRSGPLATAICQYHINDIDLALDGLYMNVKDPKTPVPTYETNCQNSNEDCQIQRAVKYQMKFSPVVPNIKSKFVLQRGEIWTHIQVLTIDRSSRQYDVIFVATSNKKIKKFYRKHTDNLLCYSETLSLSELDNDLSSIRDMRIINAKKSPQLFLLITVTGGIYKVGVEHCQIHVTEYLCVDPFCYWNASSYKCKSIFQLEVYKLRQLPLLTQCTDGNDLFDSIWKQWTSWQVNVDGSDTCDTRTRHCKRGTCANIGSLIPNVEIQVRNCTRHNQWSVWSAWSSCSSTCGPGIATRKRWCFQNASCNGIATESRSCIIDNQCNAGNNLTSKSWNDWTKCSTECGEGITTRVKDCTDSIENRDNSCKLLESKKCFGNKCQEFSKYILGDLGDGASESIYFAKCSGNVSHAGEIEATLEYDILQQNDTLDLMWECWSDWTNCSGYCSGTRHEDFQRMRTRSCKMTDHEFASNLCLGQSRETDTCKDDNCLESTMAVINEEKGFQIVYIILVGVASFTATCLIVIIGVCIHFTKNKPIAKLASFNTENNTLTRRPTYIRDSYSPITHSPPTSPGYRNDPYQADIYNSFNRPIKRHNPSPMYISTPTVPENLPLQSMH